MKNRIAVPFVVALLMFLTSFHLNADAAGTALREFKYSRPAMGTLVSMTLCSDDEVKAAGVAEEAFLEIERLEDLLSNWKPGSEVSLINRSVATHWVKVSPETYEVITQGIHLSGDSNGSFDVSVGALRRIWKMNDKPRVPSPDEIKATLPSVDFTQIQLDPITLSVSLKMVGMSIDLGGVAKGYILEKAYKTLRRLGIDNGLIDGGGDVYCWGLKPDGSKWEIGVANPLAPESCMAILKVTNKAVFTSGDYERNFKEKGTTYHHIFNPKTGYPAKLCHGVTVIGDTIPDVNGLSSTTFILGPSEGLRFLQKHPGIEAVIVTEQGEVITTPAFKVKYPDALR